MVIRAIAGKGLGALVMAEYRGKGEEGRKREFWQVAFSSCRMCLCIHSSVSIDRMGVNFGPAAKECTPSV